MSAAPLHAGPHTNRHAAWPCDADRMAAGVISPHRRMDSKMGVPDSLGAAAPGRQTTLHEPESQAAAAIDGLRLAFQSAARSLTYPVG